MGDVYREADLRRVLAEDGRIAELGIEIRCVGELVVLSGQVGSAPREALAAPDEVS
jgi:hypothetical protein